jgi:ParB/RepB/Spo0J family partition protein
VDLQAVAERRPDGSAALELALDSIESNPHQTRMDFDDELLKELARSIQVQGVLQPIVVRPGIDVCADPGRTRCGLQDRGRRRFRRS